MNQSRIVLAVLIVALGSGAIWIWHEDSQNAAPVAASAPVQQSHAAVADRGVASDASPAVPALTPSTGSAPDASEENQSMARAAAEPPDVDTPEPAERKFANGRRPESDQN